MKTSRIMSTIASVSIASVSVALALLSWTWALGGCERPRAPVPALGPPEGSLRIPPPTDGGG